LKLNGTNYLQVYDDDVNILGGSVHTIKENAGASIVASKETGLEVNADKTKYVAMYRDENARRSHSMRVDNISVERVEEFKYLGITLTYQNSIQKENKRRLKSEKACYHRCNVLSFSLLFKNFKIYRNIILSVVFYG